MTKHSDDIARADRLAGLLSDARGAEILAELHKSGRRPRRRTPAGTDPAAASGHAVAGIWDLKSGPDGVELHRRAVGRQTARFWADVEHVPGKATARRVVLLGESAARGFLLDPELTPAAVLQSELDAGLGHSSAQCVDLAKTGAGVRDLGALVDALSALEADALVLFAGNNWSLHGLTVADHDRLAEGVRAGGLTGMRDAFAGRVVLPRVRALLRRVQEVAAAGSGMDVVVVVPEFNLAEWQPDPAWQVGVLPPDRFAEWSRLHADVQESARLGRWGDVLGPAARMAELDGGTSPVPGWSLARAHEALGDFVSARAAWERARDSVTGLLIAHTPRTTSLVQEELSAFARRNGHAMVDLRTELADPRTGLPDPAYFLDYCHLSPSGMGTAMRAVADSLRTPPSWGRPTEGGERQPAPAGSTAPARPARPGDPHTRAVGHLLAACHSAWHRQPTTVLRRQVAAALDEAPDVSAAMSDLLALLTKGVPAWLTAEYDRLCARPNAERYLSPTGLGDFSALGRTALTEVLAEALDRRTPTPSPETRDDLLAGRRDSAPLLVHAPEGAFFRSAVPVHRATLRPFRTPGVRLRLSYRTPHSAPGAAPGELALDGRLLAEVPPSPDGWTLLEVGLPPGGDGVLSGELALRWPTVRPDEEGWRQRAARTLATGAVPLPVTVHGELFELRLLTRESVDHP